MKVIRKKVTDLSPIEYRACYTANYGEWGLMRDKLMYCRKFPANHPGEVILIWDGPSDTAKSLLAWSLVTPVARSGFLAVSRWNAKRAKVTAQFWVKSNHRKKGLGKKLMVEVNKIDSCPHVYPHDAASAAMFVNFNVTSSAQDRKWIAYVKRQRKYNPSRKAS